MLSLGQRRNSRATGTTQSVTEVVDPPTPDDDDAADAQVVLGDDDPATPNASGAPAGAPVIQDIGDPVIPDTVAPESSGDSDPVVSGHRS